MTVIKSYTDVNQSKKLVEIIPLESADGFWEYHNKWYSEGDDWEGYEDYPRAEPYLEYTRKENAWKEYNSDIPCWSLAALLDVLPTLDDRNANFCKDIRYDKWHVYYHSTATLSIIDTERYDNPIDACYEMILKLHELKML